MSSDIERYFGAAHAMQSGVAAVMEFDEKPTSPKHLRVGVNSAMVEHGALVGLLLKKGIITLEEYHKAIADGMEEEKRKYEQLLTNKYGTSISLT